MGNAQESICFTISWAREDESIKSSKSNLFDLPCLNSDGEQTTLMNYLGDNKCMLIVNVASGWPFATRNYKALVKLDSLYRDKGLVIIGFPCNQFRSQEPGSCNEIIVNMKQKYGVEFTIMEKVEVNGDNAHPIFTYLRQNTYDLRSKNNPDKFMSIPWNFCRWIVDRKGRVLKYLNPSVQLDTAYQLIDSLVAEQSLSKGR